MSQPESDRADAYLTIPEECSLRWSHGCDAIEKLDGSTLTLADQLTQVLEGVFTRPPVPPFAFVLHLLRVMKSAESGPFFRLHQACARVGSAAFGRNAGVLIGELCRSLPPAASPPSWPQLDLAIKRRMMFGERRRPELAEKSPLGLTEFAKELAKVLTAYDDPTLTHWLKHGGPPVAGAKLARELENIPVGIGEFLDLLRKRPRLVGAVSLAPALDAALTFPPRKPRPDRLPQGGYADVSNRGNPDQLLPSQFALEGDEFVRRFAERELLYFQREEPHRPALSERLLVLDQGVRTWGNVRLGLAAAVLALLGKDAKKAGPVRLALTSVDELLDPSGLPPEALADRLEASDLSPHPANALGLALLPPPGMREGWGGGRLSDEVPTPHPHPPPQGGRGREGNGPRDIIVLTTPRAVLEPDVRGTAQLRRPGDRLFALTVADDGRAEFGEWGPSGFVPSRRFRVDLDSAAAAKVQADGVTRPATAESGWSGDVEPIGFPFRSGIVSDVAHIGFDATGEWVVLIGRDGCMQAKNLAAGTPVEVLPRAYRNGEVLTRVSAVLGVNGGVVVCGVMDTRLGIVTVSGATYDETPTSLVVAHYDFAARGVKLYSPAKAVNSARWVGFPDLHCVAALWGSLGVGRSGGVAIDLGSGGVHTPDPMGESGLATRARLAWNRAAAGIGLGDPTEIAVVNPGTKPPESGPYLKLVTDLVVLNNTHQSWATLRPQVEGKPLFVGLTFLRAQLAGDVLAVQASGPRRGSRIFLLRGPDSRVLGEIPAGNVGHAMKLSADGKRFAVQTSTRTAVVRATEPGSAFPLADVGNAGLHSRVTVALDPHRLRLRVGRFEHAFSLNEVPFRHDRGTPDGGAKPTHIPAGYGTSDLAYDRGRFPDTYRAGPWIAAFDRWGQVVLLAEKTGRVVLHVVVRRELAAAWLPDGTRWGSAALLGDGPHPNAAVRIGLALQAATGDGTRGGS